MNELLSNTEYKMKIFQNINFATTRVRGRKFKL